MSYLDYLPDDVLAYHIFQHLERIDILNFLELLISHEELFETYVKVSYSYLLSKKTWYDQTWYQFLIDILTYELIPLYQSGELIDYLFLGLHNGSVNIKYCPIFENNLMCALFSFEVKKGRYLDIKFFDIVIVISIRDGITNITVVGEELEGRKISEGVFLKENTLEDIYETEEEDVIVHGVPAVNGKLIKRKDIENQLYYKEKSREIYEYTYNNEKYITFKDITPTDGLIASINVERYSTVKKKEIVIMYRFIFGETNIDFKSKTAKEIFDIIFNKLKDEGHYHDFDRYVRLS